MKTSGRGTLQAAAARMLSRRMQWDAQKTSAEVTEELAKQLMGRRKGNALLTAAEVIVLAIGQKALNGDKTSAEFLQKLADQASEQRHPEKSVPEAKTIIRVRLTEEGGVTAEREASDER